MKKVKFIYFDIGGVLCDTDDYFKTATEKFNIPLEEFLKLWIELKDDLTKGKLSADDLWKSAIKRFNSKNAETYNFLESWMGDYQPRPEVHKLAWHVANKYKVGLISNLYKGMMPRLIELGVVPNINYSAKVLSYEVGFQKPEPEIYELATRLAGVVPEEIFLVDDRQDFLEGAKNYGWQTIWFDEKNINKSINEIEKLLDI